VPRQLAIAVRRGLGWRLIKFRAWNLVGTSTIAAADRSACEEPISSLGSGDRA
jgi:hypothetical protein